MSKQHLSDMLKSMANGNSEEAAAHFSKYASEKTQEILARGDAEPVVEPVAVVEPEPVVEPVVEPEPVTPPADDTTA